jgi:hypothetical protein
VGTSSNLPGPRGGVWTGPNQQLGRLLGDLGREAEAQGDGSASSLPAEKIALKTEDIARRYLESLGQTLSDEPDAFGIREAMIDAGRRLVDALDSLHAGLARSPIAGGDPEDQASSFMRTLVAQVAGKGALTTDAVIRKAVATCADNLLSAPGPLQDAILNGQVTKGSLISGELFCVVYKLFFKETVSAFITTMIAGKIQVAMPLLHVIDPAGQIAHWVGEQVVAHIPDPCEKGATLGDATSLADLARGLVAESVDNVLRIESNLPGTAAA